VTGSAPVFPYTVYDQTYLIAPQLVILPERPTPTYHHKEIESYFKDVELAHYRKVRSNPLRNSEIITAALPFYSSSLMTFAALLGMFFARSIKVQLVVAIGACLCAAVMLELHLIPHYLAAGVGLIPILVAYGLRVLRVQARAFGTPIILFFVLVAFMSGFTQVPAVLRASIIPTPRETATSLVLKHDSGKHLILVRYAPSHFVHDEYVYNAAEIDAAPIVWARDMGDQANRELLDYYRDRKVWLWQPDIAPDAIAVYQPATTMPGQMPLSR
jgi:hypothetical protein